ncbi:cation-transporting P-type ATPase [Cryobacterium sp. TMT2-10]|uniref:cation-translocating P-type ATPase n=1 Tax=unclassified Cryobacterium TaxID=2649013 RepID=UPI00106D345A|nr:MULTISPECIES: cation-transporting P-type ATPase [unclassified Cryobacterium]TFD14516.1 cation-transporting P-type ATPase [Cryobacterium sp. TMT4-10]TFD18966.1 cation-transporting P-type ATPase [Cryobacterium sp. TMT2-23]TFD39416.1 cation-transporting P-type ATPase [Cryobacterium sp. TMT2-10]
MAETGGLTSEEAARRLAQDGPNLLPRLARPSPLRELARQFTHLLALLLWAAAGLALLAGTPVLAVAIVVVIVFNAVFAFAQDYRADRSTERLRALLPSSTRVRRDGRMRTIDPVDLVRDDVVLLSSGDRIAADMELTEANELGVDESMVTGESEPVRHDRGELLSAGTFVVQGEAEARVTATGATTTLAAISALARSATRPPSPLTHALNRVVRTVAVFAVTTGVVLGIAGVVIGLRPVDAFLFAVGVAVALVPEGLLPTVTLSLARGAQTMAHEQALVRRLDAVETLGATTFICTDKTGTLTQNRMSVVEIWTPGGLVRVQGDGYEPTATITGPAEATTLLPGLAASAVLCVTGRAVSHAGKWQAEGNPLDAAIFALAMRCGWQDDPSRPVTRLPYTAKRMMSSAVLAGRASTIGAPERVFERCSRVPEEAHRALSRMTATGQRVLAVAGRPWSATPTEEAVETDLELLGLLGLEDPPRPDVHEALQACRDADIRVIMVTGDHPNTAEAVAREVGLLQPGGAVLGSGLPEDDAELGELLDHRAGAVVARVTPADKLRITRVLRERGHVVAMTGDGVNDAPALREADVGVAMGRSGSDVAREAADLVLLDDHFGTIVTAVRLGRATFANARRFLTYHLTDNVAELAPFAVWALTGGQFPLAIGVLQVLALDIGSDMLPALALGVEPPSKRVMLGPVRSRSLIDRPLVWRAFGVLGPVEAAASLGGFAAVLVLGGWSWGQQVAPGLLAAASGTAFATIVVAQMANAFACRSEAIPAWGLPFLGNRSLLAAVAAELLLLLAFLGIPAASGLLGGGWPPPAAWLFPLAGAVLVILADAAFKAVLRRRRRGRAA